jgi:hypothetical protein
VRDGLAQMHALAKALGASTQDEGQKLFQTAESTSQQLIERHWEAINATALALCSSPTRGLSSAEVAALMG